MSTAVNNFAMRLSEEESRGKASVAAVAETTETQEI
jgi:hypothetical protein